MLGHPISTIVGLMVRILRPAFNCLNPNSMLRIWNKISSIFRRPFQGWTACPKCLECTALVLITGALVPLQDFVVKIFSIWLLCDFAASFISMGTVFCMKSNIKSVCCLAGGFYGPKSRISYKIYLNSLMHACFILWFH